METITSTATIDNMTISLEDIIGALDVGTSLLDPHLVGFNGEKYDFMGESGKIYNLFTSGTLQINMKLEEFLPERTYITAVGIKAGNSSIGVQEISVLLLKSEIECFYNGKPANRFGLNEVFNFNTGLKNQQGSSVYGWAVCDLKDRWLNVNTGSCDITVYHDNEMYENAICPHLNISVKVEKLGLISDGVAPHGILGITASCINPRTCTGPNGKGIIDGKPADYEVSSLFSDDCKYNRFGSEPNVEKIFGFRVKTTTDIID
jgi:hypothetical protein